MADNYLPESGNLPAIDAALEAMRQAPLGVYTAQMYREYRTGSSERILVEKKANAWHAIDGQRVGIDVIPRALTLFDLQPVTSPEEEPDAVMAMPPATSVSDGSTAAYYELPIWARELQDLIRFKGMNGAQAEIFRAIYRGNEASHSGEKRQAKKVLAYAVDEVVRTHSPSQSFGPIRDAVFAVIHSLLEDGEST